MGFQIRNNLHWCVCAGRAVFLDLEEDRYFCLSKAANDVFLEFTAGKIQAEDAGRLNSIIARGLLVEVQSASQFRAPPIILSPTRDYVDGAAPRAALISVLQALSFEMRARWLLKSKPLRKALDHILSCESGPPQCPADERRLLLAIIASFDTAALITQSHNRCLVRALAVHAACLKIGIRPKLVVGVTANPFAAHCWVQLGSAVLVGGFEQARLYTPILVVE